MSFLPFPCNLEDLLTDHGEEMKILGSPPNSIAVVRYFFERGFDRSCRAFSSITKYIDLASYNTCFSFHKTCFDFFGKYSTKLLAYN